MIEANIQFYLLWFIIICLLERFLIYVFVEGDKTLKDTPGGRTYKLLQRSFVILFVGVFILYLLKFPISQLLLAILLPVHHIYTVILERKYIRETKQHIVSIFLLIIQLILSILLIIYYFI